MWRWFRWVLLSVGIIIVLVVAFFFLFVKPSSKEMANISIPTYQDPKCTRTFTPQFNAGSYYQGPLFDSHFHIPPDHGGNFNKFKVTLQKDITLEDIVCEFEKEKVTGAIAFYAPDAWLMATTKSDDEIINQWIEQAKEIKKGLPGWIHMFYDPISENTNEANKVYNSVPGIEGFGELVYLQGESPRSGSKVNDDISLAVEKVANSNKLAVTVHPEEKDKADLEDALKKNPNTIFMTHGWGHDNYIMELMNKYPNFYFTLDSTTLSYGDAIYIQGPEDKYVAALKQNFATNIDQAVKQWGTQIQRHPDRFLWGTDKCFSFHYSEEISKIYEEYARAFIARLDPENQEMFAYKNAQDIFEKGLQPQLKVQNNNDSGGLGDLPESARQCIIEKITEAKWNELVGHTRPATADEEQTINQCSR